MNVLGDIGKKKYEIIFCNVSERFKIFWSLIIKIIILSSQKVYKRQSSKNYHGSSTIIFVDFPTETGNRLFMVVGIQIHI